MAKEPRKTAPLCQNRCKTANAERRFGALKSIKGNQTPDRVSLQKTPSVNWLARPDSIILGQIHAGDGLVFRARKKGLEFSDQYVRARARLRVPKIRLGVDIFYGAPHLLVIHLHDVEALFDAV